MEWLENKELEDVTKMRRDGSDGNIQRGMISSADLLELPIN